MKNETGEEEHSKTGGFVRSGSPPDSRSSRKYG
jgi:hypothetical protein